MAEESEILKSLVRRQRRFQEAIAKQKGVVKKVEPVQLPLSRLRPEITEKELASETEEASS